MQSENVPPEAQQEPVQSTGMSALDAVIGGMPPGVHVLVSEPHDAQELFLMHFANAGPPTIYLTTDRAPGEIDETWQRYGLDPTGVMVRALEDRPPGAVDRRLVFDSLSSYRHDVGWPGCLQTVRQVRAFLQGTPHAALLQVMPSMHEPAELTRLLALADGVLRIAMQRQGQVDNTLLRIEKMRALRAHRRHLPLTIQPKGLRIETVNRVF